MKNDQIKTIAFMAIYMALYVALKMVGNMIPFLQMPNGGSIELELIPLMIASYHLGWKYGALWTSFILTNNCIRLSNVFCSTNTDSIRLRATNQYCWNGFAL